jgi:hypothetical protein
MTPDVLKEKHYTVEELAGIWGISYEALRTKLLKTPGVLKFQQRRGKSKRPYITIRVPESVALTLYQ